MKERESWLKISDSEISSRELEREVARRIQTRREALGIYHPEFPDFGVLSPEPEIWINNAALAHHIRQLNELTPPPLTPDLAPSPATRVPLLGNLWQLVRRQFHELVLFYVNRAASHETRVDNHLISTINELTRIIQEQQSEIARLREEVHILGEEEE